MALISLGPLITAIKGSIGGITFSSNGAGTVAKVRLSGRKSTTQKQRFSIQNHIFLLNAWSNLTLSQKTSWNDYAYIHTKIDKYGKTKKLSGFNWFITINYTYKYVNSTLTTAPLLYHLPNYLPSFLVSCTQDDIIINWSIPIDMSRLVIMVFTSIPCTATNKFTRGSYRLTKLNPKDYSNVFSIKSEWEAAHGLNYNDIALNGSFYINVKIIPIDKTSYITGSAVTNTGARVQSGLGFMAIESTFIIG